MYFILLIGKIEYVYIIDFVNIVHHFNR